MRRFALTAFVLALQLVPASAQPQWREFRSDSDGFSVSLPQTPTITSRRIGTSNATQTSFLIESGPITYLVSVVQLEKGAGRKDPGQAYIQNLLNKYAEGSKTTLLTIKDSTIPAKPAINAITAHNH